MSNEPNIFGLTEYSRDDLFVDSTDAVREADRFYIMIEADAVLKGQEELIAEKDAAIAELKHKLEDVKASHYAESVDAGMTNKKLQEELIKLKTQNGWLKDENARLMSRPCYVCKEEQVKDLEKKVQELEGGTLILYNENNLRHHKYKRCFMMAQEWRNYAAFCGMQSSCHNHRGFGKTAEKWTWKEIHAWKCVKRLKKIAEKFK